jgi:hypothetical protein
MIGSDKTGPNRRRSRQRGWRGPVLGGVEKTLVWKDMERPWPERPPYSDDRSGPCRFQGPVHPFGSLATTAVNPLRNPVEAHGFASRPFDRFAFSRMNDVHSSAEA